VANMRFVGTQILESKIRDARVDDLHERAEYHE
jgi:hypothetical protein